MPLMYDAMAMTRVVKRSLISALVLTTLSVPAFSFSWGRHHSTPPQLVVDGREVLFTVLPTVGRDHVFRAPVDFVHMLGGDYIFAADSQTLTVTGNDGRTFTVPYDRENDRCIVDVAQVAADLGADVDWDRHHATMTLRAKVLMMREQGGKLNVVTSYPVSYATGALSGPSRIYVDLTGAVLPQSPTSAPVMSDGVTDIRSKQIDFNTVRIALDLNHIARVADAPAGKFSTIQVTLGTLPTSHPSQEPPIQVAEAPPLAQAPASHYVAPDLHAVAPETQPEQPVQAVEPIQPLPPVTVKPASSGPFTITGISTQTSGDGKLQVVVTTTGSAVAAPITALIEKDGDRPERYAVDLPSAVLALPANLSGGRINLDDSIVEDVRWGTAHVNGQIYTRIVLDLSSVLPFNVISTPSADGTGTVYTIGPGSGDSAPVIGVQPGGVAAPSNGDSLSPALLTTGSGSLKNLTIVVDPGHGGKDTGAPGHAPGIGDIYEKDLTLLIGKDLRDALTAEGAKVIMTREDDTFIPLPDRSQMGIDNSADIFVSVHCDSGSGHNAQEGSTVYYHSNNQVCKNLAMCIAAKIKEANYGISSDGVRTDYVRFPGVGFSVLRRSPEAAVLVECGYVNNDDDAVALENADTQKQIAGAIVAGLKDYVGSRVASIK